jgi:hypothetical protein
LPIIVNWDHLVIKAGALPDGNNTGRGREDQRGDQTEMALERKIIQAITACRIMS